MKPKQIKTIDVYGKEWFDKANGNSYCSAVVALNYGMPNAETIVVPFQYGYGDSYNQYAAAAVAEKIGSTFKEVYPLWQFCQDNKIILRSSIQRGCLKREAVAHGIA